MAERLSDTRFKKIVEYAGEGYYTRILVEECERARGVEFDAHRVLRDVLIVSRAREIYVEVLKRYFLQAPTSEPGPPEHLLCVIKNMVTAYGQHTEPKYIFGMDRALEFMESIMVAIASPDEVKARARAEKAARGD